MAQYLDDGTIEAFHRDGVTVLRGAFTEWVDTLRRGVDFKNRANSIKHALGGTANQQ